MKTIYGASNRWLWIRKYPQKRYPFVEVWHAHKDGGPVLIEESSWRTVSGVNFSFSHYGVSVQFRGYAA